MEPKSIAYNVDCLAYMKSLPDKAFDLAVVDPPYGGGQEFKRQDKSRFGGVMEQQEFSRYVDKAIQVATAEHALPAGPVPVMTPVKLAHLVALLAAGKENVWYNSGDWKAVRDAVKRIDHECIICKAAGGYSATRYVHHVKHLRDRPDLALSIYDPDTGERQLICVCKQCHEMLHPESQRQYRPHFMPLTIERWD